MATKGKEMKIEVQVSFEGESYSTSLELALCAAMPYETCGVCGGAIGDLQNATKVLGIIAIYSNEEGLPIVGHPYFTRQVFGPDSDNLLPVGLEIANLLRAKLRGKCVCPKCRGTLATEGITLSE
jgi:hypothetical protein